MLNLVTVAIKKCKINKKQEHCLSYLPIRTWALCLVCLFTAQCGFQPAQDSVNNTLYAGTLVIKIHSADLVLNNKLQREIKIIGKPVVNKKYQLDIQLNLLKSPSLYDECGDPRRWYSAINADIMITDLNRHTVSHRQLSTRQAFDHITEQNRPFANDNPDDLLAKDLAQQIVSLVNSLP